MGGGKRRNYNSLNRIRQRRYKKEGKPEPEPEPEEGKKEINEEDKKNLIALWQQSKERSTNPKKGNKKRR